MSKEKLTTARTVEKIVTFLCIKKTTVQHITVEMQIKRLLKQIRDELHIKASPFEDSSGYIYSKTLFMSEVDEVFNNYLN